MVAMEGVSYLLASVYLFSFLGLSAVASRDAGRSIWLIGKGNGRERLSMRFVSLLFASLFVWPLCLWLFGLLPGDPLRAACSIGRRLISSGIFSWRSGLHRHRFADAYGRFLARRRVGGRAWPLCRKRALRDLAQSSFRRAIILAVGLFFAFPSLVMAAISFGYVAVLRWQVAVEERALGASYPEAYALYLQAGAALDWRGPAARPNNG